MPQWIKFSLIKKPYYDPRTGNIWESINGLRNRPNIDPFDGGGKVYPDIARDKVKAWHQKDGILLLQVDILESETSAIVLKDEVKKYKASPKIEKEYNANKEFKALILTDQEADDLKATFFGIKKLIIDSGVIP